jgi:hypothetical protein
MQMRPIDDLLDDFRPSSAPATMAEFAAVEAALGMPVPHDLAEFLVTRGPGEGFVGNGGYLRINGPEEWLSGHKILEAAINWPGLLIFGSDGGGQFFGFDQTTQEYVEVDAIGDPDRRPLGASLVKFLNTVATWHQDPPAITSQP